VVENVLGNAIMKILSRLLLVMMVVASSTILGNDDIEQSVATNTMLMFLDDTEQGFDFISGDLFIALHQKAAPILATGHLLHLLATIPTLDELIQDKKTSEEKRAEYLIIKEYYGALDQEIKAFEAKDLEHSLSQQKELIDELNYDRTALVISLAGGRGPEVFEKYQAGQEKHSKFMQAIEKNPGILPSYTKMLSSFNPQEWLIKKVNSDLLLLIPLDYIEAMKKKHTPSFKPTSMTETEYVVGLPIDHMETVSLIDYVKGYKPSAMADFGLMKSLATIFIPRTMYAKEKKLLKIVPTDFFIPTWALYVSGHGSIKKFVAGLSINGFKAILEFLETQITTKLLFYSSCYAAGVNASLIYTDVKSPIFKSYPFAIVAAGLNDFPVTTYREFASFRGDLGPGNINFKQREIKLKTHLDFVEFVRNVTTPGMLYTAVVAPIIWSDRHIPELAEFKVKRELLLANIQTTPQIKLPGIPWFNVIDFDKKFVSLGKNLAIARTEDLDIVKFFRIQPWGILLYTNSIPFKLIIRMRFLPFFISMAPGNMFKMAGIKVDVSLEEFLQSFDVIKKAPAMLFWIDSLVVNAHDDNKKSYSNVCVFMNSGKMSLYTFNNVEGAVSGESVENFTGKVAWEPMPPAAAQHRYDTFHKKLKEGVYLNLVREQRESNLALEQALEKRVPKKAAASGECKRQREAKA